MRQGRVGHRFDILHFECPEIGLPRVEPEQRIVIGTEVSRNGLLSNRLIEHSAQRHAIDSLRLAIRQGQHNVLWW
jgi:hypothetical protein